MAIEYHKGIVIRDNDRWPFKKLKSKYGKEKAFDLFADRIFPTVSRSILQRHFK